jgi:hypothetical protein
MHRGLKNKEHGKRRNYHFRKGRECGFLEQNIDCGKNTKRLFR